MKEYQIQSDSSIVLPRPVYFQCLWIIRDIPRLEEVAGLHSIYCSQNSSSALMEAPVIYASDSIAPSLAVSEARFKLECIDNALSTIPEQLREGIIENIMVHGSGYKSDAHENTWKRWKQRFIYQLAVNLGLF